MTEPAICTDPRCPVCVCRAVERERSRPSREVILRAVAYAVLAIPFLRLAEYGIGDFHLPLFNSYFMPPALSPPDALVDVGERDGDLDSDEKE